MEVYRVRRSDVSIFDDRAQNHYDELMAELNRNLVQNIIKLMMPSNSAYQVEEPRSSEKR